jgi:hypothetical protein
MMRHRRPVSATIGDRKCRKAHSPKKVSAMLSTHATPLFSRAEIGIFACPKCSKPMTLCCIEPASPGMDIRTFECAKCETIKSFAAVI